jgi:hypothetical protein
MHTYQVKHIWNIEEMKNLRRYSNRILICCICFCFIINTNAQNKAPLFKVVAFYTAKNDLAHISFVHEANKWFPQMGALYNFSYDSTDNWSNLNEEFLSRYQVVILQETSHEK